MSKINSVSYNKIKQKFKKFLQGTGEGTMTYENQLKVYMENPVSEHLSEKEAEEEEEPAEQPAKKPKAAKVESEEEEESEEDSESDEEIRNERKAAK